MPRREGCRKGGKEAAQSNTASAREREAQKGSETEREREREGETGRGDRERGRGEREGERGLTDPSCPGEEEIERGRQGER